MSARDSRPRLAFYTRTGGSVRVALVRHEATKEAEPVVALPEGRRLRGVRAALHAVVGALLRGEVDSVGVLGDPAGEVGRRGQPREGLPGGLTGEAVPFLLGEPAPRRRPVEGGVVVLLPSASSLARS